MKLTVLCNEHVFGRREELKDILDIAFILLETIHVVKGLSFVIMMLVHSGRGSGWLLHVATGCGLLGWL